MSEMNLTYFLEGMDGLEQMVNAVNAIDDEMDFFIESAGPEQGITPQEIEEGGLTYNFKKGFNDNLNQLIQKRATAYNDYLKNLKVAKKIKGNAEKRIDSIFDASMMYAETRQELAPQIIDAKIARMNLRVKMAKDRLAIMKTKKKAKLFLEEVDMQKLRDARFSNTAPAKERGITLGSISQFIKDAYSKTFLKNHRDQESAILKRRVAYYTTQIEMYKELKSKTDKYFNALLDWIEEHRSTAHSKLKARRLAASKKKAEKYYF